MDLDARWSRKLRIPQSQRTRSLFSQQRHPSRAHLNSSYSQQTHRSTTLTTCEEITEQGLTAAKATCSLCLLPAPQFMSLRGILNDDLAGTANTSATSRSPSLGLSTTMTTNGQHQDEREPEEAAVGNGVEDLSSLVPDSRQRDSGIIDLSSDNEADSDINVCPPAASRGRTASGVSPNPKTSRQPFSASASTNAPPVQHNVVPSQAPCVPKKRKAAPMSIDISDDEGASSTSSSRVARQQPQASTSATTTAPATPSSSQASAIARQKEEDPDSDLEITHHSQHRAPAPTATMSQQQRQQQQQSAPHSLHPDVAVDNRPLLMGQITTVALIVAALPEICTKQPAGSPALPPVPVILYRDDPRLAQTKPDYSERTQLLTLQGVRFGTLETRLSDVLGPVLDGAPCKAHHVRFQATVQRAPPDGVRLSKAHSFSPCCVFLY